MRIRKGFVTFATYFSVFSFIFAFSYLNRLFVDIGMLVTPESMEQHQNVIDKYFSIRTTWVTSNLGAYLFKYYNTRKPPSYVVMDSPKRGYYSILIWRHRDWLEKRYGGQYKENPLLGCSVSNCKFEQNHGTSISTADAVVVHLQHLQNGVLPNIAGRKPFQRWIFWTDKSPQNTFSLSTDNTPSFSELADIFNWSMTYRSDSDVPVPYGRTIPLPYPKLNYITHEELKDLVPYLNQKRSDVLAAIIMSSRCAGFGMRFVEQLRRFLNVDMFGKCSETKEYSQRCLGLSDCPDISEYLFYIVIENSNCRQYISEKIFHHAYSKGAIPVIIGTPLEDCIKLLPPKSFIHIDNYVSIKHLAKELYTISDDLSKLLSYHVWRNNFEIAEEHGFLGTRSLAMCRLCEALNYNDRSIKVYGRDDIRLYLDPDICCYKDRDYII